jgi:hypothetical protein
MSVQYPLAIVNTASITSLVRMTLYHRAIGIYPAKVGMSEVVAALGGKASSGAVENSVAQSESEVPGGRSEENPMAIEQAKSK